MRRNQRISAGIFLLVVVLAGVGTCSLPRPGFPGEARVAGAARGEVVATAGARYQAGPIRHLFLGRGYRQAWATPVRLEVLDLGAFAGGLTPERRGNGNQTRSLHLRGADGKAYVFRSLEKDQARKLGWLARATVGRIRQDQIAALHPAATVAAAGVEEAAGVLHARPRMVVMPDDAALGAFREDFAGLPGTLAENPRDGFAGIARVVETDSLDAALRAHPGEAVDARAYLAARLVDVLLGDWDRHEGQWRWARVEANGGARWVPLPRDRDYAFADYRGLIPVLSRLADPKVVRFDEEFRDLGGLLVAARELDARFLCALPAPAWDSAAASVRGALTDPALAAAVRRMPPEYVREDEGRLERTLRARRDRLPDAARRFREELHGGGGCTPAGR